MCLVCFLFSLIYGFAEFFCEKQMFDFFKFANCRLIAVPKGKNQQKDSEKHKQELQRLVLNRKSAEDSGIEDDRDLQMDEDAVELMGECLNTLAFWS